MGNSCCFGRPATGEERDSLALGRELQEMHRADQRVMKLLLLGTGEAGKSTVLKQMHILSDRGGFSDEERRDAAQTVHANIVEAAQGLVRLCQRLQIPWARPDSPAMASSLLALPYARGQVFPSEELLELVQHFWRDERKAMQDALSLRHHNHQQPQHHHNPQQQLQLPHQPQQLQQQQVEPDEPPILDSAAYFLDAAPRCLAADYSPTNADMLRARLRTTGVTEYRLDFGSAHGSPDSFAFIDVGGQRGERRKWINAFSDVSALFYIASLSEYDQQLPEARERNRLSESLALFESLLSQRWFERVPVILFLNKYDLFVLKAREVDLGDSFPEYAGGLDEVAALKWIRDQYEAKANLPAVRARRRGKGAEKIYTHVTTATDTQGIAFVWKAVRDAVVTKSLDEFGMSLV